MSKSNWSESQFKKSKVRGNEQLWEEASEALEAKEVSKTIEAELRSLKEKVARIERSLKVA